MKEIFNMTTFFAASVGDIITTEIGLSSGMKEVGIAGKMLVESDSLTNAFILRMGVTAVIIGLYALTMKHDSRYAYSFDKALRITNIICWGALALNTVQLAGLKP